VPAIENRRFLPSKEGRFPNRPPSQCRRLKIAAWVSDRSAM